MEPMAFLAGGTTRFGVYGEATNAGTFTRLYGVYGRAPMLQSPPVNNWGSVTSWAGYFDGHVQVVGSFTSSDRKLKTDVQPFEGALELLQRLQPKSYRFDCAKFPGMNLPANRQIGLIAQEVEEVLPELVMATSHPGVLDEKGNQVHPPVDYLTLNYVALIPVLISGVKEQQELIDEQRADLTAKEAEIEMLKRRMESLERRTDGVGAISIEPLLPGLDQNIPNPFNETTVIKYFVPEKAENATILISSLDGKVARSFERLPAGRGQVVISAFSLAPGEYTYSMVIDGVQIASKTMVITS